ncbi:MAG: hypothetical protein FJY99_01950 [Candidatus Sericytochromatia bacterium]|nr:hypothetical protein [Candidatus Tanganyikabacteria bacterium]
MHTVTQTASTHVNRLPGNTPKAAFAARLPVVLAPDAWHRKAGAERPADLHLRQAAGSLDRDLALAGAAHTALAPVSPGTTELALVEDALLALEQAREALSDGSAMLRDPRDPLAAQRHVEMGLQHHDRANYALGTVLDLFASRKGRTPGEEQARTFLLLQATTSAATSGHISRAVEALATER